LGLFTRKLCLYFRAQDSIFEIFEGFFRAQPPAQRDNEQCALLMAESLSKRFGPGWSAVVGEGFSFQITHAT
jgi:hypothetical protein